MAEVGFIKLVNRFHKAGNAYLCFVCANTKTKEHEEGTKAIA